MIANTNKQIKHALLNILTHKSERLNKPNNATKKQENLLHKSDLKQTYVCPSIVSKNTG